MFLKFRKRNSNTRGVTLVEIMMAVAIIALVVIPLVKSLYNGIKGSVRFGDTNKAIQMAQELMEEIKQKKWDANEPAGGGTTTVYSAVGRDVARNEINPDSNGSNGAKVGGSPADPTRAWDDIDDYDGLIERPARDMQNNIIPLQMINGVTPFNKFTRTVLVQYVILGSALPPAVNTVTPAGVGVTTDYKQITITVNWEGNTGNAVMLKTVLANVKKY